jgi:hypothetical protein
VYASDLKRRAAERYLPLETLRALNALRKKRPALMSRHLLRIENGHKGVFSWVKTAEREGEQPILLLANLSRHTARLAIPVPEIRAALKIARDRPLNLADLFSPLMSKAPRAVQHRIAQHKLLITIPPSGFSALGVPSPE